MHVIKQTPPPKILTSPSSSTSGEVYFAGEKPRVIGAEVREMKKLEITSSIKNKLSERNKLLDDADMKMTNAQRSRITSEEDLIKVLVHPVKGRLKKLDDSIQKLEKQYDAVLKQEWLAKRNSFNNSGEIRNYKEILVLKHFPHEMSFINNPPKGVVSANASNKLIMTENSTFQPNTYYLEAGLEPAATGPTPIAYETATRWYRAMSKQEYVDLTSNDQVAQIPYGYGGITPSYEYAYKFFEKSSATQPFLVRFEANRPLAEYFGDNISQPKVENGAISIGLGPRGTPGPRGERGAAGPIFNKEMKKGNISYTLIGVNVRTRVADS